mgnify:CR=1 FL=1
MPPKKRKQIIQRPKQAPWTVVHANDVTQFKYPPVGAWFDENHARRCAVAAVAEHQWVALAVADLSKYGKPGMSVAELERVKQEDDSTDGTEETTD